MSIDVERLKGRVQEYLTTYLLKNVWNLPYTEFRQNLKLRLVSPKKSISNILVDNRKVALPTGDSYFVYECPITRPIGLYPLSVEWIKLSDFINSTGLDVRIHGKYGQWFYRDAISIRVNNGILLIAISVNMYNKIAPNNNISDVYMSLYRQPDSVNKIKISSFIINTNSDSSDALVEVGKNDIVFVNGRESKINSTDCLKLYDYVEMISDPDILGTFIIDPTKISGYKTFIDSADSKEKIIVHIPKNFNQDNFLISHNTCDVFVRPQFITDETHEEYNSIRTKGAFLNRAETDEYIGQITHNDFYIAKDLIDEYKTFYNYDNITIRIVVRRAGKTDKLVHERNYIGMLYLLNDTEILNFLSGGGSASFPFWTADVLANSDYAKTLYVLQKPATTGDLSLYLNMFGYLACLDLVCAKVKHYIVKPYSGRTMLADVPITLENVENLTCIVSINGIKIPFDKYTTTKIGNTIKIDLAYDSEDPDNSVNLIPGQPITFEIFENTKPKAEYFTPNAGSNSLQISDDVVVYKVRAIPSVDTYTSNIITSEYTISNSYELVSTGYQIVDSAGSKYVVFDIVSYDQQYLIVSKRAFDIVTNIEFSIESLNNNIITSGLLTCTCQKWSSDEEITIPILSENLLVYLNGYELAAPLDYTLVKLESGYGYITGYVCHINTLDYLKEVDNSLEIIITSEDELLHLNDFSHENLNESILSTLMWYSNINMLTANGSPSAVLQKSVDTLILPADIPAGALLHTRISLPYQLVQIFKDASDDSSISFSTDLTRMQLIREFLKQRQNQNYKLSKIEKSHNLYSIIMTLILRDYLSGSLEIDPDSNLLDQLTDYLDISNQDVIIKNNFASIFVSGSAISGVDDEYTINDSSILGLSRIWFSSDNSKKIEYDAIEKVWCLIDVASDTTLFKSTTVDKNYDPWLLLWTAIDSNNVVPTLTSEAIDLRYIDTFPSYKLYDIEAVLGYAEKYNLLKDIITAIFPVDKIQDGVTMQ